MTKPNTVFRFRFKEMGGHTHVRLFAGNQESSTLGMCGNLTFRNEEWEDFKIALERTPSGTIQILPEIGEFK